MSIYKKKFEKAVIVCLVTTIPGLTVITELFKNVYLTISSAIILCPMVFFLSLKSNSANNEDKTDSKRQRVKFFTLILGTAIFTIIAGFYFYGGFHG